MHDAQIHNGGARRRETEIGKAVEAVEATEATEATPRVEIADTHGGHWKPASSSPTTRHAYALIGPGITEHLLADRNGELFSELSDYLKQ